MTSHALRKVGMRPAVWSLLVYLRHFRGRSGCDVCRPNRRGRTMMVAMEICQRWLCADCSRAERANT